MRTITVVAACMLVHAMAADVSAQFRPMTSLEKKGVYGRTVQINTTDATLPVLRGELLAITNDSMWVQDRQGVVASVAVGSTSNGWVQRHNYTAAKGFRLGMIVGAASGVVLQVACNSVEGNECGFLAPATIALSALISGLSSISLAHSSRIQITSASTETLAPFARFPQGPPAGVDLRAVSRRR